MNKWLAKFILFIVPYFITSLLNILMTIRYSVILDKPVSYYNDKDHVVSTINFKPYSYLRILGISIVGSLIHFIFYLVFTHYIHITPSKNKYL